MDDNPAKNGSIKEQIKWKYQCRYQKC